MHAILAAKRDPRIDVLRGLALVMIFVDHIPGNQLGFVTLHMFGFADAAELFVLFAGFASMLAYGKVMLRHGFAAGVRRVGLRCLRIYATHVLLLVLTLVVAKAWLRTFHVAPLSVAPLLEAGPAGMLHGLMLHALPPFLDILPLYIVLLAGFPLLFAVMRWRPWLALAGSAALWLAAGLEPRLNLPNWLAPDGWYFDPFAWQLLFVIGAALALHMAGAGGRLAARPWLTALCWAYLALAFVQTFPAESWGLPPIRLFAMAPPDKTHLSVWRVLDILAWMQVVFGSERTRGWARHRLARPLEACGRHSLDVFALGCLLGLLGRLVLRTFGADPLLQAAINVAGIGAMCALAVWLERLGEAARGRPARVIHAPQPRA